MPPAHTPLTTRVMIVAGRKNNNFLPGPALRRGAGAGDTDRDGLRSQPECGWAPQPQGGVRRRLNDLDWSDSYIDQQISSGAWSESSAGLG